MDMTATLSEEKSVTPIRCPGANAASWQPGPQSPEISMGEVHVWRASLDVPWSWRLDEALSLEDGPRPARCRFDPDRRVRTPHHGSQDLSRRRFQWAGFMSGGRVSTFPGPGCHD